MISGHVSGGTAERAGPVHITEGDLMEPQPIEWGPAHLREETPQLEPDERPDDN